MYRLPQIARASAVAFCLASAMPAWSCTSGDALPAVLYPGGFDLPNDAPVWLSLLGGQPEDIRILFHGVEVETERHTFNDYALLFPLEPWAWGEPYEIWREDTMVGGFTGDSEPGRPGSGVYPISLNTWSETWIPTDFCSSSTEDWETHTGFRVQLCGANPFVVVVMGDDEPPAPSIDDGLLWDLTQAELFYSSLTNWPEAEPNLQTTLWVGGIDAYGTFSGWTAVDIDLPGPQQQRFDQIEGAYLLGTNAQQCPNGQWVMGDVENTGTPDDLTASTGCSCDSGSNVSASWWLLVLALCFKRR